MPACERQRYRAGDELAHVIQAAKLKELREMTPLAMAGSLGDHLMHYMRSAVDRAQTPEEALTAVQDARKAVQATLQTDARERDESEALQPQRSQPSPWPPR